MKTLLTITLLIVASFTAQAQTEQYRSYHLVFYEDWDASKSEFKTIKQEEAAFLLTWNYETGTLTIHGNTTIKVYVVKQRGEVKTEKDSDGDEFVTIKWEALDNEGDECMLMSRDWKDFDMRNWVLTYNGVSVEFYCKYLK